MADVWHYAEDGEARGPLPLADLLAVLPRFPDPGNVFVRRDGSNEWTTVGRIPELSERLSLPPPLTPPAAILPASPARVDRQVVVAAAPSNDLDEGPKGIGGWLVLVAIQQILWPVGMIGTLVNDYQKLDLKLVSSAPVTIYGEALLLTGLLILMLYTTHLFFSESHRFPRFYIVEWIAIALVPLIDIVWTAFTLSVYSGESASRFLKFGPTEIAQTTFALVFSTLWIAYVQQSTRVANTFVK